MKIFVTGVNGQLGHDVVNNAIARGYECIGSDITQEYSGINDGSAVSIAAYKQLDITDEKSVKSLVRSEPDTDWDWKKKDYRYNEMRAQRQPGYIGSYAMDNMCMSLHIVYTTHSFEKAIIKAVNLRGDSDSVASVVGQIAGAYYPIEDIPSDWIEKINKWDNEEIALRGYMLSRLHSKKSIYNNEIKK